MVADSINALLEFLGTYWRHAAGALGAGGLGSLAVFAFRRRPRPTKRESGAYFTHKTLLSPPMTRPAYSDRMAYVLAEMSALAYYEFEGQTSVIDDAVETALSLNLTMDANIRQFLESSRRTC